MKPISVSELNHYVKGMLDEDALLADVSVSGELSNVKAASSGHVYFTLKDERCSIRCALFRTYRQSLTFEPRDGKKVVAHGRCSLYEAGGEYQLICDGLREDGVGRLYEEFEKLKAKLSAEGLFDAAHKRPLPFFPNRIGVITSPSGAVIQDIRNVAGRRFPGISIVLYPAPVQGQDAPPLIIKALRQAVAENKCDVLIIARGGGSFEDLFCFNDEALAREIYGSPIPVVSAVGHETDFTIADFVADRRAPTPSAAAELTVPEKSRMIAELSALSERLRRAGESFISSGKEKLAARAGSLSPRSLLLLLSTKLQDVDGLSARMDAAAANRIQTEGQKLEKARRVMHGGGAQGLLSQKSYLLLDMRHRLKTSGDAYREEIYKNLRVETGRLQALSPRSVLKRGYSIVEKDGKAISRAADIGEGESFSVIMSDGSVIAERKG